MGNFIIKKKYGQNFLQDEKIIKAISDAFEVTENDLIIEIGPGQGALTKALVKKNAHLLCFEIDEETKPYLNKYISEKTNIVYGDFLQIDVDNYINYQQYNDIYVIANLPYYITTPIIEKIMNSNIPIKKMILMVQKEVADRFSAMPGTKEYGLFTVKLNYLYDVNKLIFVKRTCFKPVPNVDSAVVVFNSNPKSDLDNYQSFDKLLKMSFQMKRKTLKNNLDSVTYEKVLSILNKYNYPLDVRAEGIKVEHFIEMANQLD